MTNNMVQTHKTLVKTNQTGQEQSFDTVAGWCCVWCGISILKFPPTAKAQAKCEETVARARATTPFIVAILNCS